MKAELLYYAKDLESGEIWEGDDFKQIYNALKHRLRSDMSSCLFYDRKSIVIKYGVHVYESVDNYVKGSHIKLKDVCMLICSGCDYAVHFDCERL